MLLLQFLRLFFFFFLDSADVNWIQDKANEYEKALNESLKMSCWVLRLSHHCMSLWLESLRGGKKTYWRFIFHPIVSMQDEK